MLLSKSLLNPSEIQNFRPQQLAVVVNYYIHNGKRQVWMMCDDYPFQIFVIPERDGYSSEQITDSIDQHFENLVCYPSQKQFIKDYRTKSVAMKLSADGSKKMILSKVISLLGKLVVIGAQILKLVAQNTYALASFTGKQLLRLFLNILAAIIDCYEAIPLTDEADHRREVANSIRKLSDTIAGFDNDMDKMKQNKDTFDKISRLIKGEMDDAEDYKKDFMGELGDHIALVPKDGYRVRM